MFFFTFGMNHNEFLSLFDMESTKINKKCND